jgi:hypothetical protein
MKKIFTLLTVLSLLLGSQAFALIDDKVVVGEEPYLFFSPIGSRQVPLYSKERKPPKKPVIKPPRVNQLEKLKFIKIFSGCLLDQYKTSVEVLLREECVEDFYLSESEITNAQYSEFLRATGVGKIITNDLPVVRVSWEQANKFTQWMSKKYGKNYSLPTLVQWKYAANVHGDNITNHKEKICEQANVYDCDQNRGLLPVKSLTPNKWGLYDIFGNAWEWVTDKNQKKVIKGGAWNLVTQFSDLNQDFVPESLRLDNTGFRMVINP